MTSVDNSYPLQYIVIFLSFRPSISHTFIEEIYPSLKKAITCFQWNLKPFLPLFSLIFHIMAGYYVSQFLNLKIKWLCELRKSLKSKPLCEVYDKHISQYCFVYYVTFSNFTEMHVICLQKLATTT